MLTICEAIARQEGYGLPNARSTRNHNPGDIEYGAFARAHGADRIETVGTHSVPRFAHFPDSSKGFAAMKALLSLHYAGMTLEEALTKYAPPTENPTDVYLEHVCKWTGLRPDTVIDDYL
jgi:hypothetical protein